MTWSRPSLKTSSMTGRIVVANGRDHPLADPPDERPDRPVAVDPGEGPLGVDRGPAGHQAVEDDGGAGQVLLLDGLGEGDEDLPQGAFAEDDDQAGEPIADRDEVDPPDVGGARLGRASRGRRSGWRPRGSSPRGGTTARDACCTWPNWWRIISCSTGGELARVGDRLDEVAVAGVRRDAAGARVGMGQQAGRPRASARMFRTVALDTPRP